MGQICELLVPDIGDFQNVPIIELLVQAGDALTVDTPVVTLESDKASMEVPAEVQGVVTEILVREGDKVSEGSRLLRYRSEAAQENREIVPDVPEVALGYLPGEQVHIEEVAVILPHHNEARNGSDTKAHTGPAGPSVRRLARELGVNLADVAGSGAKGRLRKEDIQAHVKRLMQSGERVIPFSLKQTEVQIDFSLFGPVVSQPLSRVQKLSGAQLARNWAAIPHVTSFDEADITDLDMFRKQLNQEQPVKLTLMAFMIKAVQHVLQRFPQLNSSLQGEQLIIKNYFHIGMAVDTQNGLLVAVIRDVDKKGIVQIASEVAKSAELARKGKLKAEQMKGGTFTISSLGNIGTTHFTPIINAPEVAILGLGRGAMRPIWDGAQFVPRLILPLSLSWDHRVIDGVTASRFNAQFCQVLADFRRIVL